MLQSHIIDVNGNFVGAAVRLDKGYRFVALNLRVEELDGSIWPSLDVVRRLARQLFVTGHFSKAAATTLPPAPARSAMEMAR